MRQEDKSNLFGWFLVVGVVGALAMILFSCNGLKRAGMTGGGAAGGAAIGGLAGGPVGAIGGAAVGGAAASAFAENDIAEDREKRLENHLAGRPLPPPPPEPPLWERVPLWGWLAGLWAWLRRAHLASAITGKEPRLDAILRALGLRTHKTPIPARKGGGP